MIINKPQQFAILNCDEPELMLNDIPEKVRNKIDKILSISNDGTLEIWNNTNSQFDKFKANATYLIYSKPGQLNYEIPGIVDLDGYCLDKKSIATIDGQCGNMCNGRCCPKPGWVCCGDGLHCAESIDDCPSLNDLSGDPVDVSGVLIDPSIYFNRSLKPITLYNGKTGSEFIVPKWLGYNLAVIIDSDGSITKKPILPEQLLTFKSTFILGSNDSYINTDLPPPTIISSDPSNNIEYPASTVVTIEPPKKSNFNEEATGYVFRFNGVAVTPTRIGPQDAIQDCCGGLNENQYEFSGDQTGQFMSVASVNENGTSNYSDASLVGLGTCFISDGTIFAAGDESLCGEYATDRELSYEWSQVKAPRNGSWCTGVIGCDGKFYINGCSNGSFEDWVEGNESNSVQNFQEGKLCHEFVCEEETPPECGFPGCECSGDCQECVDYKCTNYCLENQECCQGKYCADKCCTNNSECDESKCQTCIELITHSECISSCTPPNSVCCNGSCGSKCCNDQSECGPCETCTDGACQNECKDPCVEGVCVTEVDEYGDSYSYCKEPPESNNDCEFCTNGYLSPRCSSSECKDCVDGQCVDICQERSLELGEQLICCDGFCDECCGDGDCGDCQECKSGTCTSKCNACQICEKYPGGSTCVPKCPEGKCCVRSSQGRDSPPGFTCQPCTGCSDGDSCPPEQPYCCSYESMDGQYKKCQPIPCCQEEQFYADCSGSCVDLCSRGTFINGIKLPMFWNEDLCKCVCSVSEEDGQQACSGLTSGGGAWDQETCSCNCIDPEGIRAACEEQGLQFEPNSCKCINCPHVDGIQGCPDVAFSPSKCKCDCSKSYLCVKKHCGSGKVDINNLPPKPWVVVINGDGWCIEKRAPPEERSGFPGTDSNGTGCESETITIDFVKGSEPSTVTVTPEIVYVNCPRPLWCNAAGELGNKCSYETPDEGNSPQSYVWVSTNFMCSSIDCSDCEGWKTSCDGCTGWAQDYVPCDSAFDYAIDNYPEWNCIVKEVPNFDRCDVAVTCCPPSL